MSASDSRIAVPSDRQIALWLGACFAVVYVGFADGFFKGSDEVGVFQTALALGVEGRLDVPPLMHTFPGRDGRIYSHFALGQSVLALPLIAAARVTGAALPAAWVDALAGPVVEHRGHRFGGSLEIAATTLYAPLASGVLIALFFVFERRLGVSQRNALLASALLGGTTYAAFMSGYFLRHTTEAITILAGFLGVAEYRRTGSLRALALGSGMGSLTLLIRVPAMLFAPGLAAYLLWVVIERARAGGLAGPARTAAAITAPAAAVFAVHTGLNFWRWEMWIGSPMLAQVGLLDGSLVEGVAG
ncbi:MAG: hypothetical protein O7A09_11255, partial [Proteobacteria bacterium]|nr:hypothetical protein [Pseudomonadota bacterium]